VGAGVFASDGPTSRCGCLETCPRWLGDAGIALAAFDDNLVDSYVAQRRQRTQTLRSSLALAPLLGLSARSGGGPASVNRGRD